jgi:hypothetical protein
MGLIAIAAVLVVAAAPVISKVANAQDENAVTAANGNTRKGLMSAKRSNQALIFAVGVRIRTALCGIGRVGCDREGRSRQRAPSEQVFRSAFFGTARATLTV